MKRKKKRLLVTASTFPRLEGDTEPRFILDLSKAMQKYFDVTVLVPSAPGTKRKEKIEGVRVIRYHYFPIHRWETLCYPGAIVPRIKEKKIRVLLVPFLFIGLWWKLFRILPQYDVVHAHWLIPQGIVQAFFKKQFIVTGHGGDVMSLNQGIIRKLKARCIKNASHVTVVSEVLKNEILKICPSTSPDVISMGCDISKFDKSLRKDEFFGQNGKKVVLFVGRLDEVKGVTYLIKAMADLDAKLVIVGDGPLRKSLEKQADKYADKIEFLGAKSHKELPVIYASADIFVMPSITTKKGQKEGLGLVLLEAMASGLPVIGTNSGGIPELVKDGYNGFLIEEKNVRLLSSKVKVLLESNQLRTMYSINGIKTARQRDYRIIASKYNQILRKS